MSSDSQKITQKPKNTRKKKKNLARSGDVFFIIVVFMIVVVVIQFESDRLLDLLISPYTGLILIIMIVEYLLLKSFDRTKVYERENQRYQSINRQYRKGLTRAKELLTEAHQNQYEEGSEDDVKLRTRSEDCAKEIQTILQSKIQ